jgi:hypothetical protein
MDAAAYDTRHKPTKARPIGPYSRRNAIAKIDGRRREALLIRETRDDLVAHCGGPGAVSAVQPGATHERGTAAD